MLAFTTFRFRSYTLTKNMLPCTPLEVESVLGAFKLHLDHFCDNYIGKLFWEKICKQKKKHLNDNLVFLNPQGNRLLIGLWYGLRQKKIYRWVIKYRKRSFQIRIRSFSVVLHWLKLNHRNHPSFRWFYFKPANFIRVIIRQ